VGNAGGGGQSTDDWFVHKSLAVEALSCKGQITSRSSASARSSPRVFCRTTHTHTVVSSTGRVRRAALHTYIPIYEAMDSSTTHHSWPFQISGTVPRRCTQRTWVRLPVCHIPTAGFWHTLYLMVICLKVPCQLLINRCGSIRFAQVPERVSTERFVVLIIGKSKSNHLGAQGSFKLITRD